MIAVVLGFAIGAGVPMYLLRRYIGWRQRAFVADYWRKDYRR